MRPSPITHPPVKALDPILTAKEEKMADSLEQHRKQVEEKFMDIHCPLCNNVEEMRPWACDNCGYCWVCDAPPELCDCGYVSSYMLRYPEPEYHVEERMAAKQKSEQFGVGFAVKVVVTDAETSADLKEEMTDEEFQALKTRLDTAVKEGSKRFRDIEAAYRQALKERDYWARRVQRLEDLASKVYWRYIDQHDLK